MELTVHDRVIAQPTAADLVAAVDAAPKGEDWYLTLDPDNGDSLDVTLEDNGEYRVVCVQKRERYIATTSDGEQLKAILTSYLAGNQQWRSLCRWKIARLSASGKPAKKIASSEPPTWAVASVVASIAFIAIYVELPDSWQRLLPFADSDFGAVSLVFLPIVVMVIAMIVTKLAAARKASAWPSAQGRVTHSAMESKVRQFQGEAGTVINAPEIAYEFKAHGQRYTSTRISIGEDSGGANSEATLKRYPVGAAVTVYYNPKDPSDSVLEREVPKEFAKGCLALLAIAGVIGAGIWWAIHFGQGFVDNHFPRAQTGAMLFALGFGSALLLFFYASRKLSKQASNWPFVTGKVLMTSVESHRTWSEGRTSTTYRPVVEYGYEVGGSAYRSRQIQLNVTVEGVESSAQKTIARYPEGSAVEVHYDPANPGNAALENPSGYNWVILAASLFCFGVAAYASNAWR